MRKEESDKKMKIAREAQIKQKEHFQAVQAERERQVFERILQSQIEEVSLRDLRYHRTVWDIQNPNRMKS